MNTKSLKYTLGIPVFILLTGILFSCVNDLDTIQKVTSTSDAPDEVTQNMTVMYTDSGYARIRIYATYAERFSKPEEVTKLKDGIKVDFFSETGEVVSVLTSRYGQINHVTGMIHVSDSVELRNLEKKQLLETEELHWNQRDSSIFSDKNVVVTTPDKVGYGKGIQTNQNFDFYKILKPYGKMEGDKKWFLNFAQNLQDMRWYNNIMLYFWLAIGFLMLIVITYLSITDSFANWGFYYIFVGLCFIMYFMRKWMMKRMEKHMAFLEEQAKDKQKK